MQGFSFALLQYSPIQAFTAAFISSMKLYIQNIKTVHRALQRLSVDLTYYSAHNTAAAQAAYTPTATRWRAYRQAQHLPQYQIPPPRLTLYRATQPPYYNKVYKYAPLLRIHTRRCIIAQTMPARRLTIWHRSAVRAHPPPGGAVQQRAGGTTGGLPSLLFSGFRPITNRGQQ